jgi:hypothetical protein
MMQYSIQKYPSAHPWPVRFWDVVGRFGDTWFLGPLDY